MVKKTENNNQSIREWYVKKVSSISSQIDRSKPIEEQAKQAFELRNKYKRQARIAMSDEEMVKKLEKYRPVPNFDNLLNDKMNRKNMTRDEAIKDILETSTKTNKNVNRLFGL